MNEMQSRDSDTLSGTRKIWLLLLLIVLVVVLVVYDQGAANEYGEKAYTKASTLTEKATRWAKQLYACGLPGCKPDKTVPPAITANAEPNQNSNPNPDLNPAIPANQEANTPSAFASAPTSNGEAAPNSPAGTAQAPSQATASNGQNYPSYPAYPPYTSFGANEPGVSSAATGETAPPATPPAGIAPQPYVAPAPFTPPTPPALATKPATVAGQPEVHDYPAYPTYPNYPPMASNSTPAAPPLPPQVTPARPPQELLPVPRVIRPDQQHLNQAPSQTQNRETSEGLAGARKSALAGRPGEAIHKYLQYLASNPHDFNAYGELGNVYMKIGRYPEAAQNYYEAATRLIDARQINAIASLMPVIQMYEPMLANLLNQKIAHSRESERGYPR